MEPSAVAAVLVHAPGGGAAGSQAVAAAGGGTPAGAKEPVGVLPGRRGGQPAGRQTQVTALVKTRVENVQCLLR